MIKTPTSKTLQPADKVVESIMKLRDEFYHKHGDVLVDEVFFKLNSCLYSEYPPSKSKDQGHA